MKKQSFVIGIAGRTGAGKTTISQAITEYFEPGEVSVIRQDDYYRDLSHLALAERAAQDFDVPSAFDNNRFARDLSSLSRGESVVTPKFDFQNYTVSEGDTVLRAAPVVVVEGVFIFSLRRVSALLDLRIFVDVPRDIRFIRRLLRDQSMRARSAESVVKQYLASVREPDVAYTEIHRNDADIILPNMNSAEKALAILALGIASRSNARIRANVSADDT